LIEPYADDTIVEWKAAVEAGLGDFRVTTIHSKTLIADFSWKKQGAVS